VDAQALMLQRVLIANRGEIAVRLIRGCREMGIATVAIYSDADAGAPHVALADQAVRVGPPPAPESYLHVPAILAAAKETGADAIHPGYGFLSENAGFAQACVDAGLIFIGPPAAVIRQMGSKIAARDLMRQAGVPVVPGETPVDQTDAGIAAAIRAVGFPALIKASAGGGGKGMRTVRAESEIAESVDAARREATRAFADGTLYVERLIESPRHIEVQILADQHGSTVHLFERDCTLQRRHQKVVEESPAPALAASVRQRITAAAVEAARAVGYLNAGTIEFILEGSGEEATFYFLEMNTRLQVEHPITEAVTSIDLVHAQLRIAAGEPLPFSQAAITTRGHAIECRIYAEDPSRGLLPQSGRLLVYREPTGPGVRVDSGVREGQAITVHYDPLLAKLVVFGETREDTLARAADALRQFTVLGLQHNVSFLGALVRHPLVHAARVDTGFIAAHLDELTQPAPLAVTHAAVAMAAHVAVAAARAITPTAIAETGGRLARAANDPWQTLGPVSW
jgi:acetyl-CoA carboxylase biotin carboxylase subunit